MLVDTIFLHGLKVDCVIGVWEWERRIIQTIIVDLDMAFDVRRAAKSDDISDTLSYRDVAKRVTAHVQAAKANLIERLAEEGAGIILWNTNPFCVHRTQIGLSGGMPLCGRKR